MISPRVIPVLLLAVLAPMAVPAASMDEEIDYLLDAVVASDCTFVRNGKEYSADDARSHLQLKRKRGKRYFDSAEEFVERLASKSSMSGKPYLIRCPGETELPAAEWFRALLDRFRSGESE